MLQVHDLKSQLFAPSLNPEIFMLTWWSQVRKRSNRLIWICSFVSFIFHPVNCKNITNLRRFLTVTKNRLNWIPRNLVMIYYYFFLLNNLEVLGLVYLIHVNFGRITDFDHFWCSLTFSPLILHLFPYWLTLKIYIYPLMYLSQLILHLPHTDLPPQNISLPHTHLPTQIL